MEEVVRVLGLQSVTLHLSGLLTQSGMSSGDIIKRLVHERTKTAMEWKERSCKVEEC